MTLAELIIELENQMKIAEEQGIDPRDLSVLIPVPASKTNTVWQEVSDTYIKWAERKTIADLFLY